MRELLAEFDRIHHLVAGASLFEKAGHQLDGIDLHFAEPDRLLGDESLDDFGVRLTAPRTRPSQRQVGSIISWLRFEPEVGEVGFESVDEGAEAFGRVVDADPQGSGAIEVREGSGAGEAEFERRDGLADVADRVADLGQLGVVDVTEELQREMKVIGGDPFDAVFRGSDPVDEPDRAGADVRREGDGNECSY